jgi:hypothetical protein
LLVASIAATLLTSDRDLVYNGTHTRAAELLVGVALAQLLHRPRLAAGAPLPPPVDDRPDVRARRSTWLPGAAALAGFVILVGASSLQQSWIYGGGLVGVACVSAVLIAAVVHGRFPANVLAVRPLVAVGKVSYGIYLFHWPVFLLLDEQRTGLDQVPLFMLRCLVTAALTVGSYALIEQPVRRGRVIGRDRAMVPAMLAAAAAVVVAAVAVVPTPGLTETEQLLALGEQDVVDFAASPTPAVPVGSDGAPGAPPSSAVSEPSPPDPISSSALSPTPEPVHVAVLGSEPATVAALADPATADEFRVVDDVRPDCPLSSASTPGCERLVDRWTAIAAGGPLDVVVLVTNGAEADDALAKKVAAVTDDELIALGAADEAAISEIVATIDAALAAGVEVIWYTPAHPKTAFFRHFARIGVEQAGARTVVGGAATMVDAVRDVAAERAARERGDRVDDRETRVLVIGDSTSLNFARALHDGSEGRLAVRWAGANGCPFAAVEATRGRSDASWVQPGCVPWDAKVVPLIAAFEPDVLFVMTGPMERVRPGVRRGT